MVSCLVCYLSDASDFSTKLSTTFSFFFFLFLVDFEYSNKSYAIRIFKLYLLRIDVICSACSAYQAELLFTAA